MKLSKPIIGIGIAIMILSTAFLNAQDVVITKNELPGNAKNFINKYFGGETIAYVKKDKDLLSVEYDVKFSSGTEIQFDSDGIWEEVDGGHRAIPTGFISKKVVNYINKQFPGA